MRGYESRMLAEKVGLHTRPTPTYPEPTRAEFEAHVYHQTWAAKSCRNSTMTVNVLALDAEHATTMGGLRIEHQLGAGSLAEMELIQSDAQYYDVERVQGVMTYESPAELEHRRSTWKSRAA